MTCRKRKALNPFGRRSACSLRPRRFASPRFFDTSGDGLVTALDVLGVINYVNAHPSGSGEGEMAAPTAQVATLPSLVGPPLDTAVTTFPTPPKLATETVAAISAMDFQSLPAWTQAASPPTKLRLAHVAVAPTTDLHSPPLDDAEQFDLESILEEITPTIAERWRNA